MSSSNLNHVHELLCFFSKSLLQLLYSGKSLFYKNGVSCNVHRCWKSIVAGLRLIYIIVGMKKLFFICKLSAIQYMAPVCNDLIYIHVALCATSCLPYH